MTTKTSALADHEFRAGAPTVKDFARDLSLRRYDVDARTSSRKLRIAFICDTIQGELGGGVVAARYAVHALRNNHRVIVAAADTSSDEDLRLPGFQLPLRSMRAMRFTM